MKKLTIAIAVATLIAFAPALAESATAVASTITKVSAQDLAFAFNDIKNLQAIAKANDKMQSVILIWYLFLVTVSFVAVFARMKYRHTDGVRATVLCFSMVILSFFLHKFEYLSTPFNLIVSLIVFLSSSFLSYLLIKRLSYK